jgi:hypothetical protein
MRAEVLLPAGKVKMDGAVVKGEAAEGGLRQKVTLNHAGQFVFEVNEAK